MPQETKDTPTKSIPSVVVAGDVCIDWLSVPIESLALSKDSSPPMNWQLRGGRHMFARRGGAWLTADFVEAAVGELANVLKPAEEEVLLENVPPDKIIHSMLMLGPGARLRDKEKVFHWVVKDFEGYAGPLDSQDRAAKSVANDDPSAQIILLDDSGNGFRDRKELWPRALNDAKPIVLYKLRQPLAKGPLWEHLKSFHHERTIAFLTVDDLRTEGGSISRGLSWERTATDLIFSLSRESAFSELRSCSFIVVAFGSEAAALVECGGQIGTAHLWYLRNLTEGELIRQDRGNMSGFGSSFAAALTSALVRADVQAGKTETIDVALRNGIADGLVRMDCLLEHAFGPCKLVPEDKASPTRPPEYPVKEIFAAPIVDVPKVCDVKIPGLMPNFSSKELARFRSWRILDSKVNELFSAKATEIVRNGVDTVFPDVPLGKFGKLVTLDRSEVESYRSVSNLIKEFLNNPRPERPLCLAVFGPPGGGKSFGVTEVAKSLDAEGRVERLTFNVSQWNDPKYLVSALHRVRDYAIDGKVPLVFFDEFDSSANAQKLGWLKYFLAPMHDGVFADGLFMHEIGKAIFVFAGGTSATYAEFRDTAKSIKGEGKSGREANESADAASMESFVTQLFSASGLTGKDDLRSAKLPDFDSRLRGHVDVFGLNPPTDTNLLRRALVLRSNIEKSYKSLIDASDTVRIDDGVLRAFLHNPCYYHGARSLEAILEMSHIGGRTYFDPSLLPPQHQLNLHVDSSAFMVLVQHQPPLGEVIEEIAKGIHQRYLDAELAKTDKDGNRIHQIGAGALFPWESLDEIYKRSNLEQGAYYPTLLAAAGYSFEFGEPNPDFRFSDNDTRKLAQMEHERWMEERRLKQPDHPDLKPWEELNEEDKDKDIRTIQAMPDILNGVKLRPVKLS